MDKSACRLSEQDITQTANTNSKLDPVGSTQCHRSLIDSLTLSQTLKDRATQLLIKYKSGAIVTQYFFYAKPKPKRRFNLGENLNFE